MVCNFSLDSFIVSNTQSLGNDIDYVTVSVTVGNNAAVTRTQAMGDVGDGTHAVGLAVSANIPTEVPTPVVFSYVIVNNGNSDHAAVQKEIEATLAALGKAGAQAVAKELAQPIGDAIGATIGASSATAVVNAEDVAHVATPPQNCAKDVIEIGKIHSVGDRNQSDHHRADMAKHGS
jgi:hypothetical protein